MTGDYRYRNMELQDIGDFKDAALQILENYCLEYDIDKKNIHPQVFDDICAEIGLQLFKPNKLWLKTYNNNYNEYDHLKILDVFTYIYVSICNRYKQTMSLFLFSIFINIPRSTLYNIKIDNNIYNNIDLLSSSNYINNNNNNSSNNSNILRCKALDIDQKTLAEYIQEYCENSYIKALEGSTQHMKYLPTLNKRFGYNMPGVSDRTGQKQALTSENLPKLGQNSCDPVHLLPNND